MGSIVFCMCIYFVSIVNINVEAMLVSTESVQLRILETPTLNHPIMSFKHACRKMYQPLKSNSPKIVANLIQHQKPLTYLLMVQKSGINSLVEGTVVYPIIYKVFVTSQVVWPEVHQQFRILGHNQHHKRRRFGSC